MTARRVTKCGSSQSLLQQSYARRAILTGGLATALAPIALPARAGTITYAYDGLGRLISTVYPTGAVVLYNYDSAGNRTARGGVGRSITPDAFDSQYYLAVNTDVAAAGVNAYNHYLQYGWTEGRNPSAWFSTTGYLTAYGDVKAAGMDPLEHYNQYGWHEGRDPSTLFSTHLYLQNYADVAAAGVNPLTHFLQYGIWEGRSPFGTGTYNPPS